MEHDVAFSMLPRFHPGELGWDSTRLDLISPQVPRYPSSGGYHPPFLPEAAANSAAAGELVPLSALRRFSTPSTNSFPSTTPHTPPTTHREVRPQSHTQDGSVLQRFRRPCWLPLRQCPRLPLRFPPTPRRQPATSSPNPIDGVATNCGVLQLAMGVLGALFGGSKLALGGGSKAATQTPPINASSNEEADFIKYLSPLTRPSSSQPLTTS